MNDFIKMLLTSTVVAAIIAGIFKLFQDKKLEQTRVVSQSKIEELKTKLQLEVEAIRSKISQNQDLARQAINHFQSGHQSSQERRLKSIEIIWEFVVQYRILIFPVISFYSIFIPSEYSLLKTKQDLFGLDQINTETFKRMTDKMNNEIIMHRPFAGEILWSRIAGYYGFLTRLAFKFKVGQDEDNIPIWYEDRNLLGLANLVLKNEILPDLKNPDALGQYIEIMHNVILSEMNRIISGEKASEANIELGKRIIREVQSIPINEN
jgi:hypothetical protein